MKNKGLFLLLLTFACFSINTSSQIFYQDIIPDVTLDTWSSKDIHIDSSSTSVLSYGAPGNLTIWQEFGTRIAINAFSGCEVLMDGLYPAALTLSQTIDSTGTWVQPSYAILNNGTQGNWMGVTDNYLGVKIQNGVNWLYGWIRMDVNLAGNSVTIKDYACNRTPNTSIYAGQTSPNFLNDLSNEGGNIISVYPNPFNSWATIITDEKFHNASLTIYNMHGQEIKTLSQLSGSEIKLHRGEMQNGAYIIRIIQGDTVSNIRMLLSD